MDKGKTIVVLGFKSGDEAVLTASIAAWQQHFDKCELVVIGNKCELPKGVSFVEFNGNHRDMVKFAAEKLEAEQFVFAFNAYPLSKITLSDIDKPYCNVPGDFSTGLPRLYDKVKLLALKPDAKVSFEQAYFAEKYKGKEPIVLRDLADKIRLQVYDLRPDAYRTKHLLKHKKFLVTNKHGQQAVSSFIS